MPQLGQLRNRSIALPSLHGWLPLNRRADRLSTRPEVWRTAAPDRGLHPPLNRSKIGDLLSQLVQLVPEHSLDMPARTTPTIRQVQDFFYLIQPQSKALCLLDELQPIHSFRRIHAVPRRRSRRLRQQPNVLIVPDRLDRHACLPRQGSDKGSVHFVSSINHPVNWRVKDFLWRGAPSSPRRNVRNPVIADIKPPSRVCRCAARAAT